MSCIVGIVGAESTGKTTLAGELHAALRGEGLSVALVGEYLREFCDARGRTPRVDEQAGIAQEQARRIAAAADSHDIVIADTTALMIAVYSDHIFDDTGLYDDALAAQRACTLTLLTALDIPWQADGLQRDGPHVRAPVDLRVRAALERGGIGYSIVAGTGPARLSHALLAVRHALLAPSVVDEARANPRWQWVCERCGDAACERHLLPTSSSRQ